MYSEFELRTDPPVDFFSKGTEFRISDFENVADLVESGYLDAWFDLINVPFKMTVFDPETNEVIWSREK